MSYSWGITNTHNMARYVKDPWAKKRNKGMKTLGKMSNAAFKLGAYAYNEAKKSQKTSRSSYASSQTEPVPVTTSGCLVMLIAIIIGVIILVATDLSGGGLFAFILILVVAAAIATVVSQNSAKENTKSSYQPSSYDELGAYEESESSYISDVEIDASQGTDTSSIKLSSATLRGFIADEIMGTQNFARIDLSHLSSAEKKATIKGAFDKAVWRMKEQGEVLPDIQERMDNFATYYDLSNEDLRGESFTTMAKLLIINDLLNGILPQRYNVNGALPVNLQANESLIWAENGALCYEEKIRRSTVGRSAGLSIRIASGIYYRTGAFQGQPVETRDMVFVGSGNIYITDKNFYFQSYQKTFRIPYNKIIAYIPYDDGIGIQKDGASAKPIVIKGIDSWLVYNIVTNINNIGKKVTPTVKSNETPKSIPESAPVKAVESPKPVSSSSKSLPEPWVIGNLVSEKKYAEAIQLGETLLKENPMSCMVHINLMDAYFKARNENPDYLLKSTFHAKMAMLCGHNTGYAQFRLVVNLETLWLIENAVQVCDIIQNSGFRFSKRGVGNQEDYQSRAERLKKKLPKSKPMDSTLLFTDEEIKQMLNAIKEGEEAEAREAELSAQRLKQMEAEMAELLK